jgi:N-carbamoylputrescine amidase
MGSDEYEEVVVRDLDLDMIRQVRNAWQFYRDRRPDSYAAIPQP